MKDFGDSMSQRLKSEQRQKQDMKVGAGTCNLVGIVPNVKRCVIGRTSSTVLQY